MSQDPIQPDPGGRIQPGAQVVVTRRDQRQTAVVVDNQGLGYLLRFKDGVEAWYDRASVERDNPSDGVPHHTA